MQWSRVWVLLSDDLSSNPRFQQAGDPICLTPVGAGDNNYRVRLYLRVRHHTAFITALAQNKRSVMLPFITNGTSHLISGKSLISQDQTLIC